MAGAASKSPHLDVFKVINDSNQFLKISEKKVHYLISAKASLPTNSKTERGEGRR
jgi:hypothetical protein